MGVFCKCPKICDLEKKAVFLKINLCEKFQTTARIKLKHIYINFFYLQWNLDRMKCQQTGKMCSL